MPGHQNYDYEWRTNSHSQQQQQQLEWQRRQRRRHAHDPEHNEHYLQVTLVQEGHDRHEYDRTPSPNVSGGEYFEEEERETVSIPGARDPHPSNEARELYFANMRAEDFPERTIEEERAEFANRNRVNMMERHLHEPPSNTYGRLQEQHAAAARQYRLQEPSGWPIVPRETPAGYLDRTREFTHSNEDQFTEIPHHHQFDSSEEDAQEQPGSVPMQREYENQSFRPRRHRAGRRHHHGNFQGM